MFNLEPVIAIAHYNLLANVVISEYIRDCGQSE
jgi:hypothetical protein